jgi:hypothetical protein
MARPKLKVVPVTEEPEHTLDQYEDAFLECRGLAHAWSSIGFFQDGGYVSRLVRCARCGTEKVQTMRTNGTFVRNRYEHPEGYLMTSGGVTKSDVRYEVLRRASNQTYGSLAELRKDLTKRSRRSS